MYSVHVFYLNFSKANCLIKSLFFVKQPKRPKIDYEAKCWYIANDL